MKLPFTKMHGAGNDFIVLDATRTPIALSPGQIRSMADRRLGIGADQILIVGLPDKESRSSAIDFSYRIFNADGGEVEQCGNGARAFVRFVREKGLTDKNRIRVETVSGVIEPFLEADGSVTVDMGEPECDPDRVPFDAAGLEPRAQNRLVLWPLQIASCAREIAVVSMGNPHAVQFVGDVEAAPVSKEGPLIECHPRFPKRVNAGFLQIDNPSEVHLRVWERGAGETLACGTGACAATVAGILADRLHSPVLVHTHGGDLRVSWQGAGQSVFMTGPAVSVFDGEIDLGQLEALSGLPRHMRK
ncbi:MAG: diaminopimelate epimerase [Burkholderiaceae bacterium]